jgi:hypothetical protein
VFYVRFYYIENIKAFVTKYIYNLEKRAADKAAWSYYHEQIAIQFPELAKDYPKIYNYALLSICSTVIGLFLIRTPFYFLVFFPLSIYFIYKMEEHNKKYAFGLLHVVVDEDRAPKVPAYFKEYVDFKNEMVGLC